MTLRELLDALPPMQEDGIYYELRKHDVWCCVKSSIRTNMDYAATCGDTPEEAITKMLKRIRLERVETTCREG